MSERYLMANSVDVTHAMVLEPLHDLVIAAVRGDLHPYIARERFEELLEGFHEWPGFGPCGHPLDWETVESLIKEQHRPVYPDFDILTELEWEIWCSHDVPIVEIASKIMDPYDICNKIYEISDFVAMSCSDLWGIFIFKSEYTRKCAARIDYPPYPQKTGNACQPGDLECFVVDRDIEERAIELSSPNSEYLDYEG